VVHGTLLVLKVMLQALNTKHNNTFANLFHSKKRELNWAPLKSFLLQEENPIGLLRSLSHCKKRTQLGSLEVFFITRREPNWGSYKSFSLQEEKNPIGLLRSLFHCKKRTQLGSLEAFFVATRLG
jgi:hypothetical protein